MESIIAMPKYETYKDSGYAWIGKIPADWAISRLGSCLTPVSVKNYPELPLLSITRELGVIERDIEDQESNHNYIPDDLSGYKLLKKGQFGMNKMKAWQGSYGVSKYTGIVSPAYFIFDFAKAMNPEFFNWAIRSKLYVSYFGSASDGVRVGQWDLSKTRMKDIPFILPDEKQQELIAKFLDKKTSQIDEAIAIKEKQISLLKERKQIIIQQAVTQGLDPTVPLKDSCVDWIGNIPDDWEVIPLKRLCRAYGRIGFRGYSTSDLVGQGEGAVTLSPSNLTEGEMNYSKCSYLSWDKYNESPEIQIKNGDILIVKTGSSFGKTGLVCDLPEPATINPQLLVLKDVSINADYLYFLISSCMYQDEIKKRVIGSTIPTISETRLLSMHALVPNNELQEEIVLYIYKASLELNKAIYSLNLQIDKFKEYKSSLVNSSVTGKIKITPEMVED
ncbi:restriction endonuclease subunit S [Celerinatantimonas sp. YJH-8]|uniref:restriction endonuclease subunit S n=1 Tax=Celerinatantimonas sp. YJH-8 TaxID=3228714 RepID=UPI0038CAD798